MTSQTDLLVADYLARVERAAAGLSPARREELLHDLREHIDIERAEFTTESETAIRTVLERLGDPESIAAAATGEIPRVQTPPPPPPRPAPRPRRNTPAWVIALVVAGVIVLFCLFGAMLLTFSRTSEPSEPAPPPPAVPTTVGLSAHH